MSKIRKPRLSRELIRALENALPNSQAQWVAANPTEAVRVFVASVVNHRHKAEQLVLHDPASLLVLRKWTTLEVKNWKPFVVREKFVRHGGVWAELQITYFGDDFLPWFGDMKVMPLTRKRILDYQILSRETLDEELLLALGGEIEARTSIADFYELLRRQPTSCENGVLLNDGRANIFYIRDISGTLRAVAVRKCGKGWYVFTCSITDWDRWRDGYRVFSPASVLAGPNRKEVIMPGGVR
jgi:hypothetical protein